MMSFLVGGIYLLGCSATFPDGESLPGSTSYVSVDASTTGSVRACRQFCTDHGEDDAFLKSGTMCACWDDSRDLENVLVKVTEGQQCSESVWSVYSCASLVQYMIYPIDLEVRMVKSTDSEDDFIQPGETLVFQMTTSADEDVTFTLDFGDDVTVITPSTEVAHEWAEEGHFTVNISATTRLAEQTRYIQITVEGRVEGIPPDLVDVQDSILNDSRQVELFLDAFSVAAMHCDLYYGDGVSKSFPEVNNLFETSEVYTYDTIGFYAVELDCLNMFGNNSDSHTVLAVHPRVEYENMDRQMTISIPIRGGNVPPVDSLLVFVDGRQTNATLDDEQVTLEQDSFEHSGEHIVTLASVNTQQALYRKVYNIQNAIDDISITTNVSACQKDEDIEFTFTITSGDFIHLYFNMGDGVEESWYFPQAPDPLPTLYSYSELGTYTVELAAANDVSFQRVTKEIYIERIIETVSIIATQVKELGEATTFQLEVDMDRTPAMPVEVEFDYGDGVVETVTLGKKQPKATPLFHTHIFESYSMYEVYVIVKNHISFVDLFVDVQVGEHIELVDVHIKDARVLVEEEVELTVICPHGAPIELQLDMDDGFTVVVDWPLGESLVVPSDTLTGSIGNTIEDETSGDGDLDEQALILDRKRRSVQVLTTNRTDDNHPAIDEEVVIEDTNHGLDAESEDIIFEDTDHSSELDERAMRKDMQSVLMPNDNFVIKYTYTEAGIFTVRVKATNVFSARETFLCPDVVVVSREITLPACNMEVEIQDTTTLTMPLVRKRSEVITLTAIGVINCAEETDSSYEPRYTWAGERQVSDTEWRPELLVCESENPEAELTIPAQSLWYGVYSVTVTLSVDFVGSSSMARKRRALLSDPTLLESQSLSSYLEIVASDLVSVIGGGDIRDLVSTSIVTFDLSGSHDPDVQNNNKSGMNFYLFCYTEEEKGIVEGRLLEDHLAATSMIAINSANTTSLYDYGHCFDDNRGVWMSGHSAIMPGEVLTMNGSLVFHLFVTKDERQASFQQSVKMWPTNITANALLNIDDLLASGNTDGAIMILDMVTSSLGDNSVCACRQSDQPLFLGY